MVPKKKSYHQVWSTASYTATIPTFLQRHQMISCAIQKRLEKENRISGYCYISIYTRIIIYTGHREIGLVLAGHYFLKQNLVVAITSEPNGNAAFDALPPHCNSGTRWPFLRLKYSRYAIKKSSRVQGLVYSVGGRTNRGT